MKWLNRIFPKNKKTVKAYSLPESWRKGWSGGSDGGGIYSALGYPEEISYNDYYKRYLRQDIAQRVVRAPVDATWRYAPEINDSEKDNSAFKEDWDALVKETKLFTNLRKLDILASIGRYSLLYLGFDGETVLSVPPSSGSTVVFVSPVSEPKAKILQFDTDPLSERCGLPEFYEIETSIEAGKSISSTVHWTRVLHIAENTVESRVYGTPKLEPIYNRLIGLEKLAGGSPEMFWQGARPGFIAQAAENSVMSESALSGIQSQLSSFVNNLTRWMFTTGVEIKSLAPQVSSPIEHVEVQLKLISSASQIPLRILVGSEKGELASGQDERAWHSYIETRRKHTAEDLILEPLLDRLISLNSISAPTGEYVISWKSINVTSEKERAEIARIYSDAILKYTSAIGADTLMPPEIFLEKAFGMTEEEINKISGISNDYLKEEDSLRPKEALQEEI